MDVLGLQRSRAHVSCRASTTVSTPVCLSRPLVARASLVSACHASTSLSIKRVIVTRHMPPPRATTVQSTTGDTPAAAVSTSATTTPDNSWNSPLNNPALARRVLSASSAAEVADILLSSNSNSESAAAAGISEADSCAVMLACLERGSLPLAMSIYAEMCSVRLNSSRSYSIMFTPSTASRSLELASCTWPPATLSTTTSLLLGLCKQLRVSEAQFVLSSITTSGLPASDAAVGFGKVVCVPLQPGKPLSVVQPQEGSKLVADSYTKYEYELFSGTVVSCRSEALLQSTNPIWIAARALGIIRTPPVAALHEFVSQAPDGTSRTFRVGTPTSDVPGQVGERVTVVSSPQKNSARGSGIFNASPPDTQPGEALMVTNHQTGAVIPLLRPPVTAAQNGLPGWVMPMAVMLSGGDAATSLIDPTLPALVAGGAVLLLGSSVVTRTVVVPRLKQLPDNKLGMEAMRQQLLGKHSSLSTKLDAVRGESAEDVRLLARLWQLQHKMAAVSSSGPATAPSFPRPSESTPTYPPPFTASSADAAASSGSSSSAGSPPSQTQPTGFAAAAAAASSAAASSVGQLLQAQQQQGLVGYEARIERISKARGNVESRLARKVELLDGYSRVMSMIEIEVEMDIEVPAGELLGIDVQIGRLVELEVLTEDWKLQAESRDEVERLLRTV